MYTSTPYRNDFDLCYNDKLLLKFVIHHLRPMPLLTFCSISALQHLEVLSILSTTVSMDL